ncbi:hypothetical protein TNCV_3730831 [Trichonephila clavipes]|nr:hypothetical protein TNCV_3730831 [Trichonephila clavipes]
MYRPRSTTIRHHYSLSQRSTVGRTELCDYAQEGRNRNEGQHRTFSATSTLSIPPPPAAHGGWKWVAKVFSNITVARRCSRCLEKIGSIFYKISQIDENGCRDFPENQSPSAESSISSLPSLMGNSPPKEKTKMVFVTKGTTSV